MVENNHFYFEHPVSNLMYQNQFPKNLVLIRSSSITNETKNWKKHYHLILIAVETIGSWAPESLKFARQHI